MRYKMYYWFDELIMWSSTISQKIYSSNQFIEASSKWAARRSLPLLPNTTHNFFAIFDGFFSTSLFCLFVFFCSAYQIKNSFPSFLTLLIFLTYYILYASEYSWNSCAVHIFCGLAKFLWCGECVFNQLEIDFAFRC